MEKIELLQTEVERAVRLDTKSSQKPLVIELKNKEERKKILVAARKLRVRRTHKGIPLPGFDGGKVFRVKNLVKIRN